MEVEATRRKFFTPTYDEENQETNDNPVIQEWIQNENGLMEPNETEIHVPVETEITDEERLIIEELKAFMIRNETEDYLPFNKQTCYDSSPLGCKRSWIEERQKRREKRSMVEK